MQLIHEPADGPRSVLASEVEFADSYLARARGLMFRRSIPGDYAKVFPFEAARPRSIHMLCVPFGLDVCWLIDDEVGRVETLPPWTGLGRARADTVVELPAGAAASVAVGDRLRLERTGGGER